MRPNQNDVLNRLWGELQAVGVMMVYDELPFDIRQHMARAIFKGASRVGFTTNECEVLFLCFFNEAEASDIEKVKMPEFKLR
jgi:hypothetical protein